MRRNSDRRRLGRGASFTIGLVLLTSYASAQTPDFRPAQIGTENRLNGIRIARGDMPRDSDAVALRCQTFVEVDGRLKDFHCITDAFYTDDEYYPQRKVLAAVIEEIPAQTFEPAMVGTNPVRVLMNFSVLVQCLTDSCQTLAVPNHGFHLQQYGLDYVAPQPVLPSDDWYVGFDHKLKWTRDWMPRVSGIDSWRDWDRIPYTLALDIDADGRPSGACLYWFKRVPNMGFRSTSGKLDEARDSIGSVRYIPGAFEGDPVPMRFFETGILSDDSRLGPGPYPQNDCGETR